ncbi:MAG: hypothetical protein ACLGSD_09330 [Acidobacteriota bacterium]
MATSEAVLQSVPSQQALRSDWRRGAAICAGLTAVALAVHGYHPFVEDGGVYITGIQHLLHPELYPYWSGFATAHLRYELFAPMVAALVRITSISLMAIMLMLYLAGIWATLFAGWLLVARCTSSLEARCGAVSLLALTLTIPAAGTSLIVMDPYVTARTISTPCTLFAIVAALYALDFARAGSPRAWWSSALCIACIAFAALAHPLMAAYAFGSVLLLLAASSETPRTRWITTGAVCTVSFAAAAVLAWISPRMSPDYVQVALTRNYWFVATWHWYEQFGLIAPLILLYWLARKTTEPGGSAARNVARMAVAAGATAIVVALAFARVSDAGSLVARLQPLRIYQTIYVLMLLAVGAFLGERALRRSAWRWAALFCVVGSLFYFVQEQTFPSSAHVEFPGSTPANPWEQGFLWIRAHTPVQARFALDSNYINAPQEDSQNFRAIAERSALPDLAKDGGIASIAPDLTSVWKEGEDLQANLDRGLGTAQIERLRGAGIDWVALAARTPTTFPCAYSNVAMKVCELPRGPYDTRPVRSNSR